MTYQKHPIFNLDMPTDLPRRSRQRASIARTTWPDKTAYDEQAKKLAAMFVENFKTFEKDVDPAGQGSRVRWCKSNPNPESQTPNQNVWQALGLGIWRLGIWEFSA
mgnify:CR=1 FL=1